MATPVEVLVVCTGNAARSVMAGFMLEQQALDAGVALRLTTAGTHAIEGLPVSWRTSEAVAQVEALRGAAGLRGHRSRQVEAEHLDRADLVIGMEADHVRWVRRFRPQVAGVTATLKRLCRDLQPGTEPLDRRFRATSRRRGARGVGGRGRPGRPRSRRLRGSGARDLGALRGPRGPALTPAGGSPPLAGCAQSVCTDRRPAQARSAMRAARRRACSSTSSLDSSPFCSSRPRIQCRQAPSAIPTSA